MTWTTNWLDYHNGLKDGRACYQAGRFDGDVGEAAPEYQRGYHDGLAGKITSYPRVIEHYQR